MENIELTTPEEISSLSDQEEKVCETQEVVEDHIDTLDEPSDLTLSESIEEVPDKKSRKRKSQTLNEEVLNVRDRVTVIDSEDLKWSDGSQVPRWIHTRRFYILSIVNEHECEIGLNLNGKASGRINLRFLKKVK